MFSDAPVNVQSTVQECRTNSSQVLKKRETSFDVAMAIVVLLITYLIICIQKAIGLKVS